MTTIDKKILDFFFKESTDLLNDLTALGDALKNVRIPNASEAAILAEFAQKLNRLIGGTASVGFDEFAPLSRKTALLAERCADIKELTIRLLIINLNNVVAHLSQCLQNPVAMKEGTSKLDDIERKIDICLMATGAEAPDVKSQDEIDTIVEDLKP